MKKFKFIPFVIMAFALMVTSCTINDDYPIEASNKPVVKVHFESSETISTMGGFTPYNLPVFLTEAVEGNTLLEYSVNGELFTKVISTGATSINIQINGSIIMEYEVKLLNVMGTSDTQTKLIDTNLDTIIVNISALEFVTIAGGVDVVLDWATGEDLDLYLRDEPGFDGGSSNIDYSWWDQPESMTIPSALADGDYYIGVDNFLVDPPFQVDCTLTLTFPDGNSVEVLDELTYFRWIHISKSTSGSDVTYTIYD